MKNTIIRIILHIITQILLLTGFAWSVNMISTSPNKSEYDALLTIVYIGFIIACAGMIEAYNDNRYNKDKKK